MTNQSKVAGRRSLRAILSTVIAILLIGSIFASTAVADTLSEYNVTVIDNGAAITITTTETEPIEILNKAGINLSGNDKMNISSFTKGEGGTIVIDRLNTINVEFRGNINSYQVYSTNVADALNEIGITLNQNDTVNYSLDSQVKDGMVISIKSTNYVTLTADGATNSFAITNGTVQDLINFAGIALSADDYTEPALSTPLENGMAVTVCRVEYKTETKTESLKYSTIQKKDKKLAKGVKKTIKKGVNGTQRVTYEVKYVNGEVDSQEVIAQKVKEEPTNKVVKVGTKKVTGAKDIEPNGVESKNGYKVGQTIDGEFTHYCACARCNGNSRGITASGKKIRNGMKNPYYIACNWLPLGSVLEVDGVNYIVTDRGGSSLSRRGRIDIFTPEGHSACFKYGRGPCDITIVRLGW